MTATIEQRAQRLFNIQQVIHNSTLSKETISKLVPDNPEKQPIAYTDTRHNGLQTVKIVNGVKYTYPKKRG